MAESVVCSALGRLSTLLLERATSEDVVWKEIQSVRKTLTDIQHILKRAISRRGKSESVSLWVKEVQDLAYRIEDATDIFSVGSGGTGTRQRSKLAIIRRFIGGLADRSFLNELLDIKSMMTELIDYSGFLSQIYAFDREEGNEKQLWLRQTYGLDDSDCDFVGMEEDVKRLVSVIIGEDGGNKGQVIFICGLGGTGKTTLARQLYRASRVREHFQCFAWVQVNQVFQTTAIWGEILRQLQPPPRGEILSQRKPSPGGEIEMDNVNNETELLPDEVIFALKSKKCLVVLDDVWSIDAWKRLSDILPFGEMVSKIILTTRIREVAETLAGKRFLHQMRSLTEEESWHLFAKKAFPRNYPGFVVNSEMEMIGREMVKRCGGMPLAIVVLAGIMCSKHTLGEWQMVHEHIEAYLHIGEQVGETAIHHVLDLSYDNLPYFLKPCFLYLGLFPADSDIETEKLYLLWVAEGLILSQKYGHKEKNIDVAEQYLGELVLQSLVEVQEEEVPMIRRFKSCRLNKLMRDLCLFKGKEENFLMVLDCGSKKQQVSEFDSFYLTSSARRVTICKYKDRDVSCKLDVDKHLWCLLLRNASEHEQESVLPVEISNLTELKLLRILDFDGFDFRQTTLPRGIEELVCLRYLSFKRCFLEELPSSIGKLPSLQILDLRIRSGITMRIPNVLRMLKNLMHLFLPESFHTLDGKKLQLDGLTSLETLANFNTRVCNIGDLLKLTQLQCLATTVDGSLEDLEGIIKRIYMTTEHILHSSLDIRKFDCYTEERHASLKRLLKCQSLFILHIEGKIDQIPPYKEISLCLMEIILDGSELEEDPMPILENLPSLRVLVLSNDAFVGEKMVCSTSGFSELKCLELSNLQFLENWKMEGEAMPKLHTLIIKKCNMLDMVPCGLKFVTNLKELKIIGMAQSFEDRLRLVDGKEGEDLHKVQHVHAIVFEN
ncbi:hypothetical protein ACH5RR_031572 [Cinchona calisaya]|uniref:AAA+ ATPase domain-containing protein n=1 Tax=Cinchona calisaya TaxID=153742 RepID=A0ABD2YJ33_9GENT